MKYLLLVLLISCGQHKSPDALDLKDNDGDQILNYEENEFDKNIANFESIGIIKGVIRFTDGVKLEFPFSNETDLKLKALTVAVGKEMPFSKEDYFNEWSRLKVAQKINDHKFLNELYSVQLAFETSNQSPDEIFVRHKNGTTSLGQWNPNMQVELSKGLLAEIMSGKAFLELKKSHLLQNKLEPIKEKTYRIYYSDGAQSNVYYVSHLFTLEQFLQKMKIEHVSIINPDALFFLSNLKGVKQWWLREFPNGDKAIVHSHHEELVTHFNERFDRKIETIERRNGQPVKSWKSKAMISSPLYMRIRAIKTIRTFANSITSESIKLTGGGRDGDHTFETCVYHHTSIVSENSSEVLPIDFEQNTSFWLDNVENPIKFEDVLSPGVDEKGSFWNLKLDFPHKEIEFKLLPAATNSYVTTGHHTTQCSAPKRKKPSPTQSNIEGKLSFEIESFIEKID